MIGLTPYDDNEQINNYKNQFGLTNPCAGIEGSGPEAIAVVIDGQNFYGYPTYCVICPDKKHYFNVCFPPTPECFDNYILACGATTIDETLNSPKSLTVFPNPATNILNIKFSEIDPRNIELINQFGNRVKKMNYHRNDNYIMMELNGLPNGIYLLRIETSDETFTKKITIWQ
jgi:hypothetical protein